MVQIGRSIHLDISDPADVVRDRLRAAVLPTTAIVALAPVRVADWIAQYKGKRFVGSIDGARFKLGFLPTPGAKFRVRGSVVVVVGTIDVHAVRAQLRPPLFVLIFLAVFASVVAGALALSFLAPQPVRWLQGALVPTLVFPFVVVAAFFRREAAAAEHALRETVSGR